MRHLLCKSVTSNLVFISSHPFILSSRCIHVSHSLLEKEAETIKIDKKDFRCSSYGLHMALARIGVIVKDKAFYNLKISELKQNGASKIESLTGLPFHMRGDALGGSLGISKAQFNKLLKQVTNHMSSVSSVFVQDGALGSLPTCNAQVRVISDGPSSVLSLSSALWGTSTRAVSHDPCPVRVYVAESISERVAAACGIGAQGNSGFIAADIESSSLILCGKAFADTNGAKQALSALSGPIISARGGLALPARLLVLGDSMVLVFAPEDTIQSCSEFLVSADAGVIFSSVAVAPLFQTGKSEEPDIYKLPAAVVVACTDSAGIIPSVSKLSPGQAAYHFLAGYQDGKFTPTFYKGPSSFDPLELANALLFKLKETQISSFLVNLSSRQKEISGKDFVELVKLTLSNRIPPFQPKGRFLRERYKSYLMSKFQELPKEFSF
ncbi:Phosphoenolpyruvate carboxykinase, ATP-utilizing [Dillenia turbinata]|uniref:phosphoenolpyruvate carboxykinase (ATP) n=1 Tax=Dillenia turbinata TaxID=194707 RepID=A0AAN8ZDE5_9MAGN